jgi:hypothetical protein
VTRGAAFVGLVSVLTIAAPFNPRIALPAQNGRAARTKILVPLLRVGRRDGASQRPPPRVVGGDRELARHKRDFPPSGFPPFCDDRVERWNRTGGYLSAPDAMKGSRMHATRQFPDQRAAAAPPRPAASRFWARPARAPVMIVAVLAGVAFIALLTRALSGRAAVLVLDHPSQHFPYPFTIQNLLHLVFFVGLGELFVRWRTGCHEDAFLRAGYLPEDDRTVLQAPDLGPIRRRVAGNFDHEHGFLPSLIDLAILQFQSSASVEQTAGVMKTHLELIGNRVDMRYGFVRFLAWLVPTLGFIGTVFGLGASLAAAGDPNKALDLKEVAKTLAVGFDCTMVALVQSALLVFLLHFAQEKEESAVNRAGDYTLRNLINRLYAGN